MNIGMEETLSLLEQIKEKYDSFNNSNKKISDYFMNLDKVVEKESLAYISKCIGTSDKTLKKYINIFGYSDIKLFLKELYLSLELDNIQDSNVDSSDNKIDYNYISKSEIRSITKTQKMLNKQAMQNAVEILAGASKVYILGIRNCYPLSLILSYYMKIIGIDVVLINTTDMNEIFENLIHVNEKDAFIGISFADYSLRTLRALEYVNEKNATIITITDGEYSPMNMYSSCNLWAEIGKMSIVDSLTGPLTLVNALIAMLSERLGDKAKDNIAKLDQVWKSNDVYGDDSMNVLAPNRKG